MNPNPPISSARSIAGSCRSGAGNRKGVAGRLAVGLAGRRSARPPTRATISGALFVGLLAAFGGCAHVADVREVESGFTAETLRAGGLVDLGVVQVNEVPQVRPPLIAALERVLAATRKDVRVVPAARAEAAFDDSTLRLLL